MVEQIGQLGDPNAITLADIGNTYVSADDRFVVSLIVGYKESEGVDTALEAGRAALALTTASDSCDTHWYVHDRKTGVTQYFDQSDLESGGDQDENDDPERRGDVGGGLQPT